MMINDRLTILWHSLTGLIGDRVELLDDGYFLNVDDLEWDALGDTEEEAEAELKLVAASPGLEMEWDHHFDRGTYLLATVESLTEEWL